MTSPTGRTDEPPEWISLSPIERRRWLVLEMREQGFTPPEIADHFGVSKSTVARDLDFRDPGYLLTCEWCGDLSFSTMSNARHCSKNCQVLAAQKRRRNALKVGR